MKKTIKILVVEDNKTQAEELKYFLETNNYKVQHANNGEEALALLKQKVPDIIISDIVMPEMDGYELCKRIKSDEDLKMIPVILLTSLLGPEEIFKSLECKADSFVTKPYSEDFLITKIKNILRSIKSKEDQITESGFEIVFGDQKYLIDSTRLQIIDFLLSTNENAVKKSQELDKTNKELALTQHKLNKLNENLEDEVEVRTERIKHLNTVLRAIRNINQLIAQKKDRKTLIKKACENFVKVRDFQSAWIALLNDEGKIIDFAEEGFTKEFSKSDEKFLRDYIPYCFTEALKTDDIVLIEDMESDCQDCPGLKLHKEGEWGAMSVGLKSGGKCYGVINVSLPTHYVTDKEEQSLFMEVAGDIAFVLYSMELEEKRKQAEQKSRELNQAIEQSLEGIAIANMDGKFVFVNPAWAEMHGYRAADLIGKPVAMLDSPEARKNFPKVLEEIEKKGFWRGELQRVRKDGSSFPAIMTSSLVTDDIKRPIGIVGACMDITERKQAEEALKKSEEQFRLISENTSDVISLQTFDMKATYTYISPSIKAMNGYEPEEMLGRSAFEFIHPNDKKNLLPLLKKYVNLKIKKLLTGKESPLNKTIEFRGKDKSGNWRYFQSTGNIVGDQLLFVSRDITDRKRIEEELSKSEEKYRSMINDVLDASQTGVFVLDSEFKVVWINHSIEKYFGLKKEDVIGKDKRQLIQSSIKDIFEYSETFKKKVFTTYDNNTYIESFECHVLPDENRKERLLEHRSQPIKTGLYKGGRVEYYTDITESKKAEEAVIFEQKQLLSMFDSIDEVIYVADPDTYELVYFNNAFKLRWKGNIGDKCYKVLQGIDSPCSFCSSEHIFGKNLGKTYIWEFQNKVDKHWYRCIDKAIKWPDGRMVRYEMAIDINESKQAEEVLRESEDKYRLLAENTIDCVWKMDKDLKFTYINQSILSMLGFTREEWAGSTLAEHCSEKELKRFMNIVEDELQKKENYSAMFELNLFNKDGREISLEILGKILLDENKKITGFQGNARDITERKKAEKELKKKMNELEIFNDAAVDRELIINELRKEINELLKKSGEEPKYEIVE